MPFFCNLRKYFTRFRLPPNYIGFPPLLQWFFYARGTSAASAKEYMIFPSPFSGELFQGAGVVIQLDLVAVYQLLGTGDGIRFVVGHHQAVLFLQVDVDDSLDEHGFLLREAVIQRFGRQPRTKGCSLYSLPRAAACAILAARELSRNCAIFLGFMASRNSFRRVPSSAMRSRDCFYLCRVRRSAGSLPPQPSCVFGKRKQLQRFMVKRFRGRSR